LCMMEDDFFFIIACFFNGTLMTLIVYDGR